MNPGTTFIKTEKGKVEMAERSGSLSVVERRLLILIDGKRSQNDLLAFVRGGELDEALEQLQRLGLIEWSGQIADLQDPPAQGYAAAEPAQAPRPATSVPEFEKVRDEAARFVAEKLGASGAPICDAIERCTSPTELRNLLRGVEIFVGQRVNAETAHAFVQHFGALLL
jgi:hypothetical protein